jgi:superfamily II DNA or RNA helicase
MTPNLYANQLDAIKRMHNGCVLCGGVGTGKSLTGLGYYFYRVCDSDPSRIPLYVITTAKKRDDREWEMECLKYGIPDYTDSELHIDSWNNIVKYKDVERSFFIFDEHKAIGSGAWAKTFVKIAKKNKWIILSATPGDNWKDYIPVFVANGFYKNRTEFINRHVIINPYVTYFSIKDYIHVDELVANREKILVDLESNKIAEKEEIQVLCNYDSKLYFQLQKDRWNFYENKPVANASELCYLLRKVVNSDPDRIKKVIDIVNKKKKVIIFYNFDYELELLKKSLSVPYTEWNGHKHQQVLNGNEWVYLVQYSAGAEGWNCITSDTIIFYSQSYSYKQTVQAAGRIDRLNTPFKTLYYYKMISSSGIDRAIERSLIGKKDFNSKRFVLEE